jgi:hypothetical protein
MKILGIISVGFDVTAQLTTDQILCIPQIMGGKKWDYNERVHQLFIDFKKVCNSVSMEVLYNILIEFGVPMKLVRLIKMCLKETYSKVRIGKYFSDDFPIPNGLKQGDALSPLLFNFTLEYTSRKVQENHVELKLNGTHQLLVYANDVTLLGEYIYTMKKNRESLTDATKEAGVEVNTEKTEYTLLSHHQNVGKNHDVLKMWHSSDI